VDPIESHSESSFGRPDAAHVRSIAHLPAMWSWFAVTHGRTAQPTARVVEPACPALDRGETGNSHRVSQLIVQGGAMESGKDLFIHELKDIYDAENKLVNALGDMAKKVKDPQLQQAFETHRQTTEQQVQRLEQVFGMVDRKPTREKCDGINGLIEEFKSFVKEEDPSPEILNLFATSAAAKVEHYEISSYRSLIKLADQMGLSEAARLFQQTLQEEEETAQEMEMMSEKLGQEVPA
jgi:ferritin-like metal-binding protein YciE